MSLDTYTFFLIVLGGVMVVWSFRKVTGSTKDIKEIEYLIFASFWGTVMVSVYAVIMKGDHLDELQKLIGNPFAAGTVFGMWGLLLGSISGLIEKKTNVLKRITRFFGKWFEC